MVKHLKNLMPPSSDGNNSSVTVGESLERHILFNFDINVKLLILTFPSESAKAVESVIQPLNIIM